MNIDASKMAVRRSERIKNQKREGIQGAEPSAKRKKDKDAAKSDKSPDQLKITDLNDDCLEHIFKKLELVDLLNIADSRKSLREGVDRAFKSKYRNHVHIHIWQENLYSNIYEGGGKIEIDGFVNCLKFLRCFGKLISTLMVPGIDLLPNRRLEAYRYLNKYCTATLNKLTFYPAPKAIAGLRKLFTNVRTLCLGNCVLGMKWSNFNKWFPHLQHLAIWNSIAGSKCIEVHLPHLIHFDIHDGYTVFESENVQNCIRLNPQLQIVRVSNVANLSSIVKLAGELLHLKELHIGSWEEDYKPIDIPAFVDMEEVVHFANVKKFVLNYSNSQPLSKLPLSFKQLEEFSVKLNDLPPNDILQEFINIHSSVKKMDIDYISYTTWDSLQSILKSASELLQLEELNLQFRVDTFDNMQEVIHFKNVTKFKLIINYKNTVHERDTQRLSKLPMSFEKLDILLIEVDGLPPSDIIRAFISLNPSVTKVDFVLHSFRDLSEVTKKGLKETWEVWSIGHGWRSTFKFGDYLGNMRFERIN